MKNKQFQLNNLERLGSYLLHSPKQLFIVLSDKSFFCYIYNLNVI